MAITDDYYLAAGGWLKREDNSGPYAIDSNGTATLMGGGGGGGGGPVTVDDITDASAVGKSVMKAANAAAARTAIGAGTPYTLPTATASAIGGVKSAAAPEIVITDPADDENIQAAFDSLVAALKQTGVLT